MESSDWLFLTPKQQSQSMESNRWQPKMHSGFDTMHLTRAQKLTGSQKITEKYKKCEAKLRNTAD